MRELAITGIVVLLLLLLLVAAVAVAMLFPPDEDASRFYEGHPERER